MIRMAALTVLVLAAATARAEPPEGFAAPSPSLIEQLRSQHQRHDWLRVTMASTQLELRALRIDAEGLSGLTARGSDRWRLEAYSDPSSHGHIAWSSISRIDKLHSQSRGGWIAGFITGGILGANLPQPSMGAVVGGFTGAWLGRRIGDQFVSSHSLYVAQPSPAPSSIAATTPQGTRPLPPDSVASRQQEPAPATQQEPTSPAPADPAAAAPTSAPQVDTPPTGNPSPEVLRACRGIKPENLLRIEGDFGRFQGHVLRVGPEGLDGLRASRAASHPPAPPGLVPWDRIDRVEKRGGSPVRGALFGGVTLGCLGGLVSAAAVSLAGSSFSPSAAFVEGALVTGAIGGALGALVGTAIPGWHVVYKRPPRHTHTSRP